MLQLTPAAQQSLRSGVGAAKDAVAGFAHACAELRKDAPPDLRARLDLSVRRLTALQRDLDERTRHGSADALFVTLAVTQAALSGLSESMAEMRHAVKGLVPFDEPVPGWFIDEEDSGGV